ncbi:MAG: bifunctional metallophosphatase/5'-nucleotidase [Clostridia bacterium]|nr:bifunctional metallophosphatase/5'-nucleotidase [Clostridia bacterium]
MKRRILSILLVLAMMLSLVPAMAENEVTEYTGDLVLFLTNDMHSNLGPSKIMDDNGQTVVIGGMARLAAAVTAERAKAGEKALALDGGDYSQGTPYQDGYQKGWELMAMGALGIDFTTLGNHEFDVGDQAIENSYVNARANAEKYGLDVEIPQLVVSNMFIKYDEAGNVIEYTEANIVPDDLTTNAFATGEYAETGAVNYAVTEVNGYKVGLFGLVGSNAYGYCKNSDLTRMECSAVANVYAKFLKEEKGCDIVICISHCGDSEDVAFAEASEGYLDVIQSAHSHTPYDEPIVVNDVIIMSTGCYAQNLGVLSLKKTETGWDWVKGETRANALDDAYAVDTTADTAEAKAYNAMNELIKKYDAELVADGGYFSKLGITEGANDVLVKVPQAMPYIQKVNGKSYGYTYVQSPLTAFIGDSFNYAAGSDVAFIFGGYVRSSVFQGEFTVSDAFNIQSTGESAIDRSAGASLIVAPLSGLQLMGICVFDAMCSGTAENGTILYGGAGTLHTAGMRYNYKITDGKLSCDTSSIEVFSKETQAWEPLDLKKGYLCSFTFESTQNLVSYMPMLTGGAPFAPYDEATGTYAEVPADNTSDEYYAFWAPYAKGVGVLEGTDLELKAWTAMYYYAKTMNGQMSDAYLPENIIQTRFPAAAQ